MITRLLIKKIEGEKKVFNVNATSVKPDLRITGLKRIKDESSDYVVANFMHNVVYEPDIGYMIISGVLNYTDSNMDEKVSGEGENVKLKPDAMREVSNVALRECLVKGISLSREVGLPLPMQFPTVNVNEEKLKEAMVDE